VADPADLGVLEASALLAGRSLSSRELTGACLRRIVERDGVHSHDGDPGSINAWIRVYEGDALAAADAADARLAGGDAPPLCGVPIGLKDLYAVAGKPLTASSSLLNEVPDRDCDVWARLGAEGMVLLGHLHTHEFAAGGTTDQVGNPADLTRSAGGSSGGSAAALASRTTPAATGTDTAGSLRIPSAMCGTATIKPTRSLVSIRGIVPLAPSFDHAGPMTRTLPECEPLFAVMSGASPPPERRELRRVAVSPRIAELDADVAANFDRALAHLPLVSVPPPDLDLEVGSAAGALICTEMLVWHRRFDDRREGYRASIRGFLDFGEARALTGVDYAELQQRRVDDAAAVADWFAEHRLDAIVEPTVPIVARARGRGYDEAFTDLAEISLTQYWNWVGFPVAAFSSGCGPTTGLPTSVSLIGPPGSEWELLAWGAELERRVAS
jgi:aspartyl-tRNA(Asn)/glutamyl-tRNA(Gln) amidotransferase subunit A